MWRNKFREKNFLNGYFGTRILKNYCRIWNQLPRVCLIADFCWKAKSLNLRPKKTYLRIFDQICLFLAILGNKFRKLVVFLKSSSSNLSNGKVSLRNKNASVWHQRCLFWVFLTKNASFGYFWSRILKILMSYLKSAPWNFSNCKILQKNKNT